ncbi:MAG: sigma 54-interacting transcriptional regulator, partial [Pseudomonadota bacterium]|nr:sigma 54-interacting transcriptional regulator [Pseudomonadota bacterium]
LPRYESLARSSHTVLIVGETGSGKTQLAAALHRQSSRAAGPFRIKGCGEIVGSLFPAELFGHERGAFTGADHARPGLLRSCDGGTLVLDDIDALSPGEQSTLLRFLDSGAVRPLGASAAEDARVDVRIIATTNADLGQLQAKGALRPDFFFRLSAFSLRVPPLRERRADFADIVRRIETEILAEFVDDDLPKRRLSADALRLLQLHDWPGNLRELRSTLLRVNLMAERGDAGSVGAAELITLAEAGGPGGFLDGLRRRARANPAVIQETLRVLGGNKALTARATGFSREAIYQKIEKHGWRL